MTPFVTSPPAWAQAIFSKDSLVATVILVLLAAFAKYRFDLTLARRNDRLSRVTTQLRDFYGPLYAAVAESDAAWRAFSAKFWPDRDSYFDNQHFGAKDVAVWKKWMSDVAMPINDSIAALIRSHADLVRGSRLDASFKDFLQHVADYHSVMPLWETLDVNRLSPSEVEHYFIAETLFPVQFPVDVERAFLALRSEQQMLINALQEQKYARR